MLIHLPTLKTLGFCCGTRANRLLSHPDNTPVVRTSNAKPSGCPGDFVTKRRRRAVLHSRAGLLRQKTRYRRNRLLPQGTQPPTSATQPVAASTATPADHHVPSTTSVARRVNAERDRDDVKSASCYYPHHDAARVVVALVRISMQPFEFDANLVVRKQMLAACRVWVDQLDRRR